MPQPPQPETPPHSVHHNGSVATRYARGERPFVWPPLAEGPVEPTLEVNYEQEEIDRLDQINQAIGRLELTMQQGLELPPLDLPTPIYNPPSVNHQTVDLGPMLELLNQLLIQFGDLRSTIETRVGQDRQPSVVYGGGARKVGLQDINGNNINPAQEPGGVFKYYTQPSGAGTITVAAGERVRGISGHWTTAGSITIFGGAAIAVPANDTWFDTPENLIADGSGTIVFAGSDSCYVRTLV